MYKSAVFHGNSFMGEVEIYPQNTNAGAAGAWIRELRISHFSPPSERCPPLAVLHTVAPGGVRFKMASRSPTNDDSPLLALHAACLRDNKTAVVSLGEEEMHLVAMVSQKNLMRTAYFWGFNVATRLYDYSLMLLNMRCLGIVFDLDETLILANTQRSFEDRIDALQRKMNNEIDPQRIAGILAEIKRYQDDKYILKQYTENDQVIDNGKIFKVQSEVVQPLSDSHQVITRPIIRLQEKNIILTRINPSIRDTSVLVRLRPAWEDLRSYLTARGRKRFEVYVCTMAERDYALEMWRLLDPDSNLIDSTKLLDRIVCVKSGMRKSLLNVFQGGICHPKMALVIDDRLKVWDEKDQPRVHVVPAFAPYYAPQAEASNNIPVLCVARNVACNVRGGFFKEFDEVLLPQLNGVLYEDDLKNIQDAPDVGNFLVSEDDTSTPNVNRDQQGLDGMAGVEVERRLKEASCNIQAIQPTITSYEPITIPSFQQVMPSSGATTVKPMQVMMPLSIQGQSVPLGRSLGQVVHPEPSFQNSPAREEGEVPESELDPDTRRRLLILQHGQDSAIPSFPRDPTPPFPVRPPLNVSVPPAQPPGTWFTVDEEIDPRQVSRTLKEFNVAPETSQYNNKRTQHPSFFRGEESSFPPQRVHEKRRLPFQLNHGGGDNVRTNHGVFSYSSFQGEDARMGRNFSSHKLNHFEPGQADFQQADSPAAVLKEIAAKCGTKVEFRSALCDTTELQFVIEVLLVGQKIGEGIGRTRKEAQHQAADISIKYLADKYVSSAQSSSRTAHGNFLKQSQSKENGFVSDSSPYPYQTYNRGDILPVASTSEDSRLTSSKLDNSKAASPVSSLKELCLMEGLSLVFQPQPLNPTGSINKGQESAQVEVSGQVLGRGVGSTWDEAKHQASEQALGSLRSMLGQFAQKQPSSPRSLSTFPNKRLKSDFSHSLQ